MLNRISCEECGWLERIPSSEEVKAAVWFCEASKALGVDDFNLNFIRKMWASIGANFIGTVLDFFLINGGMLRNANLTWVTLVPKFDGAFEIKDFRSVSMVGYI